MSDQLVTEDRDTSASERRTFETVNPATVEPGRSYTGHTVEEAHEMAAAARSAFEQWRRTTFADRA